MNFFTSSFNAGRFLLVLGAVVALAMASVIAFNGWFYVCCPESSLQRSFTATKGGYDVIVVGSSRANAYPPYFEGKDIPVLNFAAEASTPYEMKRRLEHALRYSSPRQIVMGLDFFSFNTYWSGGKFFREYNLATPEEISETLFRLKRFLGYTTEFANIKRNLRGKYKNAADETVEEDKPATLEGFLATDQFYMEDGYNPLPYMQYKLSHDVQMKAFDDIVRMAKDRNIDLVLVMSPIHARLLEIIRLLGLWDIFETWKREVVQRAGPYPVYDAMIYTPRTTVPIDRPQIYYRESSHFTPLFAARILQRIENAPGEDGPDYVVLSPAVLETHLELQRAAQRRYGRDNPDTLKDLEKMYATRREAKALLGF